MRETRPQVGQFHIVGGEARAAGPYTGLFTARGLDDAVLHVLVEPAVPGADAVSGQVAEAMGHCFRRQSVSTTGALLRCLQAAHEELVAWNRLSLRQQRAGVGVSCLALRHSEAYMAQVGPTLAYVRAGGSTKRLAPEPTDQSLGLAEELRPSLTRHLLADGDAVLLAFSALASRGDETVAAALAYPLDEALRRIYALVNDLPYFAALLVTFPPISSRSDA